MLALAAAVDATARVAQKTGHCALLAVENQSVMRNLRRLFAVTLLLLGIACSIAFAETSPDTSDQTGIEGVIVLSPNRPGPIRKDMPGSGPLANIEFVVRKGDKAVSSFTTDAKGAFHVSLPPGHYTVERKDWTGRIGHFGPFEVDVAAGEATKVEWRCDSGMR